MSRTSFVKRYYRITALRCFSVSTQSIHTDVRISLSEDEEALFTLFRNVVRDVAKKTTVRVAGGWVRDKILGNTCKNDVDIALDNMSGSEFAAALNKWCQLNKKQTFAVGVILSNPDKSKHLETCTTQIGPFAIDFVNLRTETYTNDSRIPQISIGTPLEDALRRDLTINSLFYNVNTNEIEDFTTAGLIDLYYGIVRTPLPPLITLRDDPLRALRIIRFACRLKFMIKSELYLACFDNTLKDALSTKVSEQRVADEVIKMLTHPSYARAITLLHTFSLLPTVLKLPEASKSVYTQKVTEMESIDTRIGSISEIFTTGIYTSCLCQILLSKYIHSIISEIHVQKNIGNTNVYIPKSHENSSNDLKSEKFIRMRKLLIFMKSDQESGVNAQKILNLALLTAAFDKYRCDDPSGKKKKISITEYLLQRHLHLASKDVVAVDRIHSAVRALRPLLRACRELTSEVEVLASNSQSPTDELSPPRVGPLDRLSLGLVIGEAGNLFPLVALAATADACLEEATAVSSGDATDSSIQSGTNLVLSFLTQILGLTKPWMGESSTSTSTSTLPVVPMGLRCLTDKIPTTVYAEELDSHAVACKSVDSLYRSDGVVTHLTEDVKDRVAQKIRKQICAMELLLKTGQTLELLNSDCMVSDSEPVFDGHEVKKILNSIPPGRTFQKVMQTQNHWRLCRPHGTLPQLKEYLLTSFPNYVK